MNAPSLEAKLVQSGQLANGPFHSEGVYRAARFPKIRVETTTKLRGLTGTLIEVCDGQVLWTERRVEGLSVDPNDEDSTGIEVSVTRRDIDLIRDALAASPQTPEHVLAAELGVGGLPSLLAGLQWAFDFRTVASDQEQLVLQGRWKPAVRTQLEISGRSARVPTEVEVVFRTDSPVPERVSYIRTTGDMRVTLLSMAFRDAKIGQSMDEAFFSYQVPDDVEVTNRTADAVKAVEEVK